MNDELNTKEYLKSIGSITLADSTRLRMRDDLLAHARFHGVSDVPAPIKSPFLWFALKPVQVAFAFALIVGTSGALYLQNGTKQGPLATLETPVADPTTPTTPGIIPIEIAEDDFVPNPPVSREVSVVPDTSAPIDTDAIAFNTRAKSAPESGMADDAMMSTMLSEGTWTLTEYEADVTKRADALQSLIKKYEGEFSAEQKVAFLDRLDTAQTLRDESTIVDEMTAYELLDKAAILIGEVEAELSLLGQVVIEDGIIVDIDFSVDPAVPQ